MVTSLGKVLMRWQSIRDIGRCSCTKIWVGYKRPNSLYMEALEQFIFTFLCIHKYIPNLHLKFLLCLPQLNILYISHSSTTLLVFLNLNVSHLYLLPCGIRETVRIVSTSIFCPNLNIGLIQYLMCSCSGWYCFWVPLLAGMLKRFSGPRSSFLRDGYVIDLMEAFTPVPPYLFPLAPGCVLVDGFQSKRSISCWLG